MDHLVKIKYPLNQWDKKSIRPGPVGSVGDCMTAVRIAQSTPDMAVKYSKTFSDKSEPLRGSNVQDGDWASFSSGGFGARVVRSKIRNGTSFKTPLGWYKQDVVTEQRLTEPKVAPQGRVGFETQAASILYKSGSMFGDLPGGYSAPAGVLPRGGMYPRVLGGDNTQPDPKDRQDFVLPQIPRPIKTANILQSLVGNLPDPQTNLNKNMTDKPVQDFVDNQAKIENQNLNGKTDASPIIADPGEPMDIVDSRIPPPPPMPGMGIPPPPPMMGAPSGGFLANSTLKKAEPPAKVGFNPADLIAGASRLKKTDPMGKEAPPETKGNNGVTAADIRGGLTRLKKVVKVDRGVVEKTPSDPMIADMMAAAAKRRARINGSPTTSTAAMDDSIWA